MPGHRIVAPLLVIGGHETNLTFHQRVVSAPIVILLFWCFFIKNLFVLTLYATSRYFHAGYSMHYQKTYSNVTCGTGMIKRGENNRDFVGRCENMPNSPKWAGLDSNQRRLTPTGLQPVPFSHSGTDPNVHILNCGERLNFNKAAVNSLIELHWKILFCVVEADVFDHFAE